MVVAQPELPVPVVLEFVRRPSMRALGWPLIIGAYVVWYTFGAWNRYGDSFFPTAVFLNALWKQQQWGGRRWEGLVNTLPTPRVIGDVVNL